MPANDQDLRALTYLVRRLRDETHGCNQWDEAGTFAVLKAELAGTHLATAIERVIGHAPDPDAKTPGAIKRPFVPDVAKSAPERPAYDPRKVCHVCGVGEHVHGTEHAFISVEANRARASRKAPDELRSAITPTRTFTHPAAQVGAGTTEEDE